MFCHAPTVRRQTAAAGESCWMLQSLVASRFDNAFVLDVIQGTVRDILSGRHHFFLIFMWLCHGPREGLGLLWAIRQGLQAFKVQLSLLCLCLLGPLNNFTSLFTLNFLAFSFFSSKVVPFETQPCLVSLRFTLPYLLIAIGIMLACLTCWVRMVFITCSKKKKKWNLNQATHEVGLVSVSCWASETSHEPTAPILHFL